MEAASSVTFRRDHRGSHHAGQLRNPITASRSLPSTRAWASRSLPPTPRSSSRQPLEIEDEFRSLYEAQKATNEVLEPKFNPTTLMQICFRNSILQQCIHVMEVNIDGTGHTIELIDQGSEKEKKAKPKPPPDFEKNKKPPFSKQTPAESAKDAPDFVKKAAFPFGKPPGDDEEEEEGSKQEPPVLARSQPLSNPRTRRKSAPRISSRNPIRACRS